MGIHLKLKTFQFSPMWLVSQDWCLNGEEEQHLAEETLLPTLLVKYINIWLGWDNLRAVNESWNTVTSCLRWNLYPRGFKLIFSVSSAKLKDKKKRLRGRTRCRKDFIWNYKHNTHTLHEKKTGFLYIHISDILYLTISTLASLWGRMVCPHPSHWKGWR